MNILLQILDEGKTNDAHGRSVNFANTVIIMTSNAGSERKENALGFAKDKGEVKREKAVKALNEFLRPEFIGRIDEIVVFNECRSSHCYACTVFSVSVIVVVVDMNSTCSDTWVT